MILNHLGLRDQIEIPNSIGSPAQPNLEKEKGQIRPTPGFRLARPDIGSKKLKAFDGSEIWAVRNGKGCDMGNGRGLGKKQRTRSLTVSPNSEKPQLTGFASEFGSKAGQESWGARNLHGGVWGEVPAQHWWPHWCCSLLSFPLKERRNTQVHPMSKSLFLVPLYRFRRLEGEPVGFCSSKFMCLRFFSEWLSCVLVQNVFFF